MADQDSEDVDDVQDVQDRRVAYTDEAFADFLYKEPVIWNYKLPDHKKKPNRDRAYGRISKKFREPEATVAFLMDQYTRLRKNRRQNEKRSSGSAGPNRRGVPKPKDLLWFLDTIEEADHAAPRMSNLALAASQARPVEDPSVSVPGHGPPGSGTKRRKKSTPSTSKSSAPRLDGTNSMVVISNRVESAGNANRAAVGDPRASAVQQQVQAVQALEVDCCQLVSAANDRRNEEAGLRTPPAASTSSPARAGADPPHARGSFANLQGSFLMSPLAPLAGGVAAGDVSVAGSQTSSIGGSGGPSRRSRRHRQGPNRYSPGTPPAVRPNLSKSLTKSPGAGDQLHNSFIVSDREDSNAADMSLTTRDRSRGCARTRNRDGSDAIHGLSTILETSDGEGDEGRQRTPEPEQPVRGAQRTPQPQVQPVQLGRHPRSPRAHFSPGGAPAARAPAARAPRAPRGPPHSPDAEPREETDPRILQARARRAQLAEEEANGRMNERRRRYDVLDERRADLRQNIGAQVQLYQRQHQREGQGRQGPGVAARQAAAQVQQAVGPEIALLAQVLTEKEMDAPGHYGQSWAARLRALPPRRIGQVIGEIDHVLFTYENMGEMDEREYYYRND